MKADALLFWLSARREGSWRQFRAAVEEIHATDANDSGSDEQFQMHQRLRVDFECLAHTEFFVRDCRSGWRVTPPTLAVHPTSLGWRAILCGARSSNLIERVLQAGRDLGCETSLFPSEPTVIRIFTTDVAALAAVASRTGILFQSDTPLAILSQLSPCVPSPNDRLTELPEGAGWRIREFDSTVLCWRATDRQRVRAARTALFEFQLYDRWRYFLRRGGETFELPRAEALYLLLRRRRGLLQYHPALSALSLPGSCRPPRLIERALVLCSGFSPSFAPETGRLTYADVPPGIALLAAELLSQTL